MFPMFSCTFSPRRQSVPGPLRPSVAPLALPPAAAAAAAADAGHGAPGVVAMGEKMGKPRGFHGISIDFTCKHRGVIMILCTV